MADQLRIRAYNVGFGDCLLIDAPAGGGRSVKILVDCGSISFGDTGVDTESLVNRLIADVTDDGVPRIDVIVATHRHRDHVLGFGKPQWRDVEVGEVWLPWTENPADQRALALVRAQETLARALRASSALIAGDERFSAADRELIDTMGLNALTNAESMDMLHYGFAGHPRRRYLSRDEAPVDSELLGDITVRVLGPSTDVDVLRQMDPPDGQSYLSLLGAAADRLGDDGEGDHDSEADADDRDVDKNPFPHLESMGWEAYGSPEQNRGLTRKLRTGDAIGKLRQLVRQEGVLSAAALDRAVNNTSLILSIEVDGQFLLLPGDAQWGSWQLALTEPWSAELIGRTTFYKIGHHGSHNATPRDLVAALPPGTWAVASVTPYAQWKEIPKTELLEALEAKAEGRVLTTMAPPAVPPAGVEVLDGGRVLEFRPGSH